MFKKSILSALLREAPPFLKTHYCRIISIMLKTEIRKSMKTNCDKMNIKIFKNKQLINRSQCSGLLFIKKSSPAINNTEDDFFSQFENRFNSRQIPFRRIRVLFLWVKKRTKKHNQDLRTYELKLFFWALKYRPIPKRGARKRGWGDLVRTNTLLPRYLHLSIQIRRIHINERHRLNIRNY